jgi:multidrug resistance efflux pump
MARDVLASGTAAGIREAYVVSMTQGTISRTSFSLGQYVKKGHVLVSVENSIQKAAYENAQKTAEMTAIALRSMQALYDQGNASEMEMKKAQSRAMPPARRHRWSTAGRSTRTPASGLPSRDMSPRKSSRSRRAMLSAQGPWSPGS